jgi:hypothetical protein
MEMIRVAYDLGYNGCFCLSEKAKSRYIELKNDTNIDDISYNRSDPVLIQVIEELGKEVNLGVSDIRLKTIPKEFEKCYGIVDVDCEHVVFNALGYLKDIDVDKMTESKCASLLKKIWLYKDIKFFCPADAQSFKRALDNRACD